MQLTPGVPCNLLQLTIFQFGPLVANPIEIIVSATIRLCHITQIQDQDPDWIKFPPFPPNQLVLRFCACLVSWEVWQAVCLAYGWVRLTVQKMFWLGFRFHQWKRRIEFPFEILLVVYSHQYNPENVSCVLEDLDLRNTTAGAWTGKRGPVLNHLVSSCSVAPALSLLPHSHCSRK